VELTIRSVLPEDQDALLALAIRAWEPVFASVNEVLGDELAHVLHGEDWRNHQVAEVREILGSHSISTWVAHVDGKFAGFVAARVADPDRRIGEVAIVGVDPAVQHLGIGGALMRRAEAWLEKQGMAAVFVETGGDPGHLPARSLYDSLGYRLFPSAQYFRVLTGKD
jgi:GNAT superfamily N-acetyltransferase